MNWPMLFVGLLMVYFGYLIWTTIQTDDKYRKRMAIKRHFEILRAMEVDPKDYHLYEIHHKE